MVLLTRLLNTRALVRILSNFLSTTTICLCTQNPPLSIPHSTSPATFVIPACLTQTEIKNAREEEKICTIPEFDRKATYDNVTNTYRTARILWTILQPLSLHVRRRPMSPTMARPLRRGLQIPVYIRQNLGKHAVNEKSTQVPTQTHRTGLKKVRTRPPILRHLIHALFESLQSQQILIRLDFDNTSVTSNAKREFNLRTQEFNCRTS